jgi:hypothetical protein
MAVAVEPNGLKDFIAVIDAEAASEGNRIDEPLVSHHKHRPGLLVAINTVGDQICTSAFERLSQSFRPQEKIGETSDKLGAVDSLVK